MTTPPVIADPSWAEAQFDDADLSYLLRLLFAEQHATSEGVAA